MIRFSLSTSLTCGPAGRVCSQPEFQRRRRADYHRQKIAMDPEYANQYVPAPVFTNSCEVNGVVYGVDSYNRIWAQNAVGRWFIIGRIVATPNGYVTYLSCPHVGP